MIDVFKSLRSLVKISRLQIDNNVLRLHYSFTVLLLMAFCVVVSTKQYVGEPIDCVRTEAVSQSVINTYCWMHTTYTIPKSLLKKVGVEVPHPGIDQVTDSREFRYHSYYQWVCFVLFVQATLFYAPRWLWKLWEGGKLQALVMDLEVANCSNQERRIKCDLLANYLMLSRGNHDWYAARFFFCEILALANVLIQMYALNKFFGGEFYTYGLEVLRFAQMDHELRVDPMVRIFPKVTKCKFYKYGPSANIESVDALCLLPINIINEKIYVFIWFWFVFLVLATVAILCLHALLLICPPLRAYMLNARSPNASLDTLHAVLRRCSAGDWFLLHLLAQNVDSIVFAELIEMLAAGKNSLKSSRDL